VVVAALSSWRSRMPKVLFWYAQHQRAGRGVQDEFTVDDARLSVAAEGVGLGSSPITRRFGSPDGSGRARGLRAFRLRHSRAPCGRTPAWRGRCNICSKACSPRNPGRRYCRAGSTVGAGAARTRNSFGSALRRRWPRESRLSTTAGGRAQRHQGLGWTSAEK